MQKAKHIANPGVLLIVAILLSLIYPASVKPVAADPGILSWSIINTPSSQDNIVVSPAEINAMVIGADGFTFYAVDIAAANPPNGRGKVYKSGDGGTSWQYELSAQLIADGAFIPVWNIAVAADDPSFIVAITDGTGGPAPSGPQQVYVSTNGGARWDLAVNGLSLNAGEYISCVDVSMSYGGTKRDIAIGTRDGAGTGRVFVLNSLGFGNWNPQDAFGSPPSTNWFGADVVALKFSPTYASDSSLVVVSSDNTNTRCHLGFRDTVANTTAWDNVAGYPVLLWDPLFPGNSPTVLEMIIADLELTADFSGQDAALRRFYVSTDTSANQAGVYRIDDTVARHISYQTSNRISSIAYSGTYDEGLLLAGEVTANPALGQVRVWRTVDPAAISPIWLESDNRKSPTGGGNSGNGNAQVAWNPDAVTAYCGTSSACLGPYATPDGSINCATPEWPDGYLNELANDESAFSVSPYTPAYGRQLISYTKTTDSEAGNIWNQLSLIDTEMDVLTDVAALQAPLVGESLTESDYDILYLFSKSDNVSVPVRFNSIWRSTSTPLGRTWERVLCLASDNASILRVRQPAYDDIDRSDVVVFASPGADMVGYSGNEGQVWNVLPFTTVTDLALSGDNTLFILNDVLVYRFLRQGTGWILDKIVNTELDSGHTIATPLKNPVKTEGGSADMVLVGEAGQPLGMGRIVYADLSETLVAGGPPLSERIAPPVPGDAHVIFDDNFNQTEIIYNAVRDPASGNGKIYRWQVGESSTWGELEPPNAGFYGVVQRNSVLYGAWRTPQVPAIAANNAGVDRTLYPRVALLPPPPEWDYLVAELPVTVLFNREPSSLKISSNDYNNLWAIDNQPYNFAANVGCLWGYTDIIARVGPWTTAPPSGSYISVDPVSGRAVEVNFSWRQVSYASAYELQIAKDENFYIRLLVNDNIVPEDQLSPSVYFPAGGLAPVSGSTVASFGNLESGHTYYWRVRARRATTGEIARSPWSATMYFTVEAGLPTASPYPSITLFSPTYGARNVSNTPGFSWSGLPGTTKYEITLAKDAALQEVVIKTNVPLTSYTYEGKLDSDTTYFWQVRALEPIVSDPSPVGSFTVLADKKSTTTAAGKPTPIPTWVWWIIGVFTALVASIIAFTMVKPSYVRPRGGKLFKVEPVVDKPKGPAIDKPKNPIFGKIKNTFVKIGNSIVMALRRQRYLKKKSATEPKESKPEESKSEDSQSKLT